MPELTLEWLLDPSLEVTVSQDGREDKEYAEATTLTAGGVCVGTNDNQSGELEKIQKLSTRVQELESELDSANNRYSRHTAMADLGIVDAEVRELVEWQYEKATKGDAKAPALNEWLAAMKADPSTAPVTLRHHLQTETAAAPAPTATDAEPVAPAEPVAEQPALIAPKTNTGTAPAPMQSTNLLNRGLDDFEFYKANRDAIRKAWPGRGR